MRRVILLMALSLGIFTSCKDAKTDEANTSETEQAEIPQVGEHTEDINSVKVLYVASTLDECVGAAPKKCLMVKEEEDAPWELMYQDIEGFDYQEGYEYKIEVKREEVSNPAADAPSIKYVLVNEISKEKKG